jgi:hypothetical protein
MELLIVLLKVVNNQRSRVDSNEFHYENFTVLGYTP